MVRTPEYFRELLVADLALVLDVATARDVAVALDRYWNRRDEADASLSDELARVAGLSVGELLRLATEVDRAIEGAGGDSRTAVRSRFGFWQPFTITEIEEKIEELSS